MWTLWLSGTAFVGHRQTKRTGHRLAAGHEPVCFVHAKMTPDACALLEFTTAPLPILRVSGVVDIGTTTAESPALDIAALCLDSWPAANFAQVLVSDSCQRLHVSLQQTHLCKMILRSRAACHCIMAWRFCLTNTCFASLPFVYPSMVPGNLPSQLEILSTGQTYCET